MEKRKLASVPSRPAVGSRWGPPPAAAAAAAAQLRVYWTISYSSGCGGSRRSGEVGFEVMERDGEERLIDRWRLVWGSFFFLFSPFSGDFCLYLKFTFLIVFFAISWFILLLWPAKEREKSLIKDRQNILAARRNVYFSFEPLVNFITALLTIIVYIEIKCFRPRMLLYYC